MGEVHRTKKGDKNEKKKVKGKSGSCGQESSPICVLHGGDYIVKDWPEWKVVQDVLMKT